MSPRAKERLRGTPACVSFLQRIMLNRTPTLLLALIAAASSAAAQEAAPAPTPAAEAPAAPAPAAAATRDAPSIVLAARPADTALAPISDSDGVARTVSPGIAQALSDGMPKYSPPTPTPVQAAEPVDMREVDKPKNEIPRLPAYVVRESRPPMFSNREMFTQGGMTDFSIRSHPGLAIGNLFGLNEAVARDMFYEDERLASIADMTDTARAMARGGDTAEAQYILQSTQDTYMRAPDMTWNGPGGGGGFSGGGGK